MGDNDDGASYSMRKSSNHVMALAFEAVRRFVQGESYPAGRTARCRMPDGCHSSLPARSRHRAETVDRCNNRALEVLNLPADTVGVVAEELALPQPSWWTSERYQHQRRRSDRLALLVTVEEPVRTTQ